jgi:hypothetical protein
LHALAWVLLTVRHNTVHKSGEPRRWWCRYVRCRPERPMGPSVSSPLIQLFFRDARRLFASFLHTQAAAG